MYEEERIITVNQYLTPSYCKEKNSMIVLRGKWLRDLGFAVGRNISVKVSNANDRIQLIVSLVD